MEQPTTLMEALELTLETLGELKASGIEVTLTPSRGRQSKETVDEHNRPDRLKPCWWLHATMKPTDKAQDSKIFLEVEKLRRLGIGFDTGGFRNWELDWSFRLKLAISADLERMNEKALRGPVGDGNRKVNALVWRGMHSEKFFSEYLPRFCATWMAEFKAKYKTKPDFEDAVTFATDCIIEYEEIVHGREIGSSTPRMRGWMPWKGTHERRQNAGGADSTSQFSGSTKH